MHCIEFVPQSELNEELTAEVSDLTDDFMANSDKIEDLESKLRQYQEMTASGTAIPAAAPAPVAEKPAAAGQCSTTLVEFIMKLGDAGAL